MNCFEWWFWYTANTRLEKNVSQPNVTNTKVYVADAKKFYIIGSITIIYLRSTISENLEFSSSHRQRLYHVLHPLLYIFRCGQSPQCLRILLDQSFTITFIRYMSTKWNSLYYRLFSCIIKEVSLNKSSLLLTIQK